MSLRYTLSIVLILFLISCSKDPREINIYDIPDEFAIDLHQVSTEVGTQPAIRISTMKNHPCENSDINAVLIKKEKTIEVAIREITEAQNCVANPGKLSIELYAILPTDYYDLKVSLRDQIFNDGKISVHADLFTLSLYSDHGLQVGKTEILKIPDHHVWGYVTYPEEDEVLNNSLSEMLRPLLAGPSPLYTGEYGIFSIDSAGEIHFPGIYDSDKLEKFLVISHASKHEIKEIIEDFKNLHPGADIHVDSSFGTIL